MCVTAWKNFAWGMFTWGVFIACLAFIDGSWQGIVPHVVVPNARPLVFFVIILFFYGLSLVFRKGEFSIHRGRQLYGLRYGLSVYHREDVISFQWMFMPITFTSMIGIVYATLGYVDLWISFNLVFILWYCFFLLDSAHSQGELFSRFEISQVNPFSVFQILLDIVGIVLSFISMLPAGK